MSRKVRHATSAALILSLFGLVGCSNDSTPAPSKTEGSRPRDEQQKAREFGGDASKAVPQKGRSR